LHPSISAHPPVRSVEKVLDLGVHDRLESGEERAAQSVPESLGAFPDDKEQLGGRGAAASVRGYHGATGRLVPEATSTSAGGRHGGEATRTSSPSVRAARAGRKVVRRDRGDHGLQSRHGKVAVESRAE